jgi:hypothetical protein
MNADADLPPPPAAPSGWLLAFVITIAALFGLASGTLVASSAATLIADGLDLGQIKERLIFAYLCGALGGPTGMAVAIWFVLRSLLPRAHVWHAIVGFSAGAGLAALTAFTFFFAVTTPPPPVLPHIHVEIRVRPAPEPLRQDDTFLSVVSGREGRGPTDLRLGRDADGRNVVRGTFWLSRQSPVEQLVLRRRGLAETRFTLNLPADPPSTGDYTHWLSADRATPGADDAGGETIEMRFRIDRRVER